MQHKKISNINSNWILLANYLKSNLNKVKQSLGSECTFLSFITSKEYNEEKKAFEPFTGYYAIMKNNLGGKDNVTLKISKPYSELKPKDFRELAMYLGNKEYEQGTASTITI